MTVLLLLPRLADPEVGIGFTSHNVISNVSVLRVSRSLHYKSPPPQR